MHHKKSQGKKSTNKFLLKIVIILLAIFLTALLVLLSFEFGIAHSIEYMFHKPQPIVIQGECYAAFNSIIYQISNDADCQKQCADECWVRKKTYLDSEFISDPSSCNLCNCYCK
jgi:hypothetical protein